MSTRPAAMVDQRPLWRKALFALHVIATPIVLAALVGCGGNGPENEADPARTPPAPEEAPAITDAEPVDPGELPAFGPLERGRAASPESSARSVTTVAIQAVDLDGAPLEGMQPIATRQPNALDDPVARGPLTGLDGQTTLSLPAAESPLFVRMLDPRGQRFANNYVEADTSEGAAPRAMAIIMVPGARLEAIVAGPSGEPPTGETCVLTMIHPDEGTWWTGAAEVLGDGRATFPRVPAGVYDLRFSVPGAELVYEEAPLRPDGHLDLGVIHLRPAR